MWLKTGKDLKTLRLDYRKNLNKLLVSLKYLKVLKVLKSSISTPWKGGTYSKNLMLPESVLWLFGNYLVLFGVVWSYLVLL